jgi:hypothetical protein
MDSTLSGITQVGFYAVQVVSGVDAYRFDGIMAGKGGYGGLTV